MSKKKLNTDIIANELEGASLFFTKQPVKDVPVPAKTVITPPPQPLEDARQPKKKPALEKRKESTKASMSASTLASSDDDMTEIVRKKVKQLGKEVVFLRLTPEEKRELSSVVYTLNELYRGEIRKTTENEVGRIGLNYLLEDYKLNGEGSILARVIKALNA